MSTAATSAADWLRAGYIGFGTWAVTAALIKASLDHAPAPQKRPAAEAPPAPPVHAAPLAVPPRPTQPPRTGRHAKPAALDETTPLQTVQPSRARHTKDTHATR